MRIDGNPAPRRPLPRLNTDNQVIAGGSHDAR